MPPLIFQSGLIIVDKRPVWEIFIKVLALLSRFEVWVPLLLYLALKLVVLALYVGTTGGVLASIWQLFMERGYHEALVHYPTHLFLTPVVLSRLDYILEIFVHSYLQGVTILLFAAAIQQKPVSLPAAFKRTLRCYRPLIVVTVVVSILLYLSLTVPARLLPRGAPPLFRLAGWGAATTASLVIQALFLYASPAILIERRSVLGAVRESVRLTRQTLKNTMVLVIVSFVITLPAVFLGFKSQLLAMRLSPEVLPQIQVVSELFGFFSTLVLIGGLTVMFFWRKFDEKKRPKIRAAR